jgi:chloramphenicol-sensitive protein RarD
VSRDRSGFLLAVAAYSIWGLFPLYWPFLEPASAPEILAHRIVWSLVLVVVLLLAWRRLGAVRRVPAVSWRHLVVAAVLISVNWGVYIYAVTSNQVVEASLGYFISPLVTVGVAVVVLDERLRRGQWGALALAALAVLVLAVDNGRVPWIALVLASSFALYGLLKKKADVGAAESLLIETSVLGLPALAYLVWLDVQGDGTFGRLSLGHSMLLAGAGLVTLVPLLAFSGATTRIPLSTVGLVQYITPSLQFVIGVFLYHEPMPPARIAGFVLVWTSLALFTVEAFTYRRRQLALAATPTG